MTRPTPIFDALEERCRTESRAVDREYRAYVAKNYHRSEMVLREHVSPDRIDELMESIDPKATWQVIRHLCKLRRKGDFGVTQLTSQSLRVLITCELHLWRKQRAAKTDKAERDFLVSFYKPMAAE